MDYCYLFDASCKAVTELWRLVASISSLFAVREVCYLSYKLYLFY